MIRSNWLYIAVMFAVSYTIRILPLTLIRKPIKNQFIQSFLYYVPYVTLAVMTFPAIVNATQSPAAGAVALVVGIAAAWFGASLFQVSVACCAGYKDSFHRAVTSVNKEQFQHEDDGAGGFVGARILDMWRGKFALCAFPSDTLRTADENAVLRFILKEHPDVIVHTAALSNTQYCQQEPEDSFRANVLLPEWIAKGAEEVGAKLLSCSSDQVYAGVTQRGALAETLPLSPSNVYGQHKLEAEARVLARCPDAVALRLPWMYDLPGYHLPIRGNLPLNILKAAKTGEVLRFSRNDYRGVGYVREVIENLIPAMELPGGVYNFGSECDGDMVETARCFANLLQVDVKIEESDLTRNLAMDTGKLRAQGIEFSSTWGALRVCLGDYRLGYLM